MGPVTGARMPLLQQGDLFARRFEIDRPVGAGGRGTVYRARDQHSGDFVARKLLHGNAPGADDSERFVLEAQILAELQHPGIVGYVAHGQTQDGQRFFAIHRGRLLSLVSVGESKILEGRGKNGGKRVIS